MLEISGLCPVPTLLAPYQVFLDSLAPARGDGHQTILLYPSHTWQMFLRGKLSGEVCY